MQAVVTNGISTLVTEATTTNFGLLADDIQNIGNAFNLIDIANFGNLDKFYKHLIIVMGLVLQDWIL